jgi:hypothetical protein
MQVPEIFYFLGALALLGGLAYGVFHSQRRQRETSAAVRAAEQRVVQDPAEPARVQERHARRNAFAVATVAAVAILIGLLALPWYSSTYHEGGIGSPGNPTRPGSVESSTQ